ncbi:MAG: hypothetical protein J4G12_04880 [Gemmatimonadetes bacterium]|nr:hypothetical protein [Gemmatimonadota bacterium]
MTKSDRAVADNIRRSAGRNWKTALVIILLVATSVVLLAPKMGQSLASFGHR